MDLNSREADLVVSEGGTGSVITEWEGEITSMGVVGDDNTSKRLESEREGGEETAGRAGQGFLG